MIHTSQIRKFSLGAAILALFGSATLQAVEVGDTVPYVVLDEMTVEGKMSVAPVSATATWDQSYALVEFFSISDAASRGNLAALVAQAQDLASDVTTRVVAVDANMQFVKEYREDFKDDFKHISLAFDTQKNAMRAFKVTTIPTILVINHDNKVLFKAEGALTQDKINGIRKAVNYDVTEPVTGPIKVGDTVPAMVLPTLSATNVTATKDVRSVEQANHKFTMLTINSTGNSQSSVNLLVYRDIARTKAALATVRYVSIDSDPQAVANFVKQNRAFFPYSVAFDPQKVTQEKLGETVIPATYVLDSTGKVLFKKTGALSSSDVQVLNNLIR